MLLDEHNDWTKPEGTPTYEVQAIGGRGGRVPDPAVGRATKGSSLLGGPAAGAAA